VSPKRLLAAGASAIALAGCGTQGPTENPPPAGPYSQEATADCLEQAGYAFELYHGDPVSGRAEDIVSYIEFSELGEIRFYDPSVEVPAEGQRYGNAVLILNEDVSPEDHDTIVGCLR
jgi:predicted small lipoprotein YifL